MMITPSYDSVAEYRALARIAAQDVHDVKWIEVLAQLFAANARGQGHISVEMIPGGLDLQQAPAHLIACDQERLLLPRTAAAWRQVRNWVAAAWADESSRADDHAIQIILDRIHPAHTQTDAASGVTIDNAQQRLAVASLVDARTGVLTGGPGTGKTTTIAALIAARAALDPTINAATVLACAPTGKAAQRLGQALHAASHRLTLEPSEHELLLNLQPCTIHRALGWSPIPPEDGGPYRHNAQRPLSARMVIVDEASMADVELMAHLIAALPNGCQFICIGDRDQLESVAAGGVLAELVQRGSTGELSSAHRKRLATRLGQQRSDTWRHGLPHGTDHHAPLPGLAVGLSASYRAWSAPWILQLAQLVRPHAISTLSDIIDCCTNADDNHLTYFNTQSDADHRCEHAWTTLGQLCADWRCDHQPNEADLSAALNAFQLIVASNLQVERANHHGLRILRHGLTADISIPHGAPILIEANAPQLGLANGEIGLALGDGLGTPARTVCFPGHVQPFPLAALPRHQPAFAITIHKSQGSEWQHVLVALPDHADDLLDRNLVYTAVTRAAQWVGLLASQRALEHTLSS